MRFVSGVLTATLLLLDGCSTELTEHNVQRFVDDADHAFLAGHAADICNMRSADFKFTGTTFKPAADRVVSGLEEAMKIDRERQEAGERPGAELVTMNAHEYCRMAIESRQLYRRMSLVRTSLEVSVSSDHKQATVRAHYVVKAPEYVYGNSNISRQDRVESQVGTLQTETDEESVVTQNDDGKLVFSSTHATSWEFHVQKERDSRL